MQRVRDEFDLKVKKPAFEEDPSLATKPIGEVLKKLVTTTSIQNLDFIEWCMKEALRKDTPAQTTAHFEVLEDIKAGPYHFKKGDLVMPALFALHHNSKYWQRPYEFLPDRFNPDSPLFLTPDGGKRSAYAWLPFSAGNRVCLGSRMGAALIRFNVTYLTEFFDISFKHPEDYKNHQPRNFAYMPECPGIPLILKRKKGVIY